MDFLHQHMGSPFKALVPASQIDSAFQLLVVCYQVIDTITELLTNNAYMLVPADEIKLGKHINDCFVENISKSLHNQHKTELW